METAVINVTDAFKKQFGMLWTVLEYTGISTSEKIHQKGCGKTLVILSQLCFPLFLLCNMFYCCYITLKNKNVAYSTFLDSIIPVETLVLWLVLYSRRNSLRLFLNEIARTSSTVLVSKNRFLPLAVNAGLCLTFFYPVFLMLMRVAEKIGIYYIDFFRYLQEIIFPSIVTLLYTSLCYILLQNLRSCKYMIQTKLNITKSITVKKLKNIYLEVIKEIQDFEELFSVVAFIIILRNFCVVSFVVMDMIHHKNWFESLFLEAASYLVFIFVSTGVLSTFASNIPLEIQSTQSILLDKLSEQSYQDGIDNNEKQIVFLLQRDICVLTAWKLFSFERGFLLNAIVTVVVHVVAFDQLTSSTKTTGNCTDTKILNNNTDVQLNNNTDVMY